LQTQQYKYKIIFVSILYFARNDINGLTE